MVPQREGTQGPSRFPECLGEQRWVDTAEEYQRGERITEICRRSPWTFSWKFKQIMFRIEGTYSVIRDIDGKPTANLMLNGERMMFLRSATRQRCVFLPLSSNIVLKLLAGEIRQEKETKRIWIWKEDVKLPFFAVDMSSTWTLSRTFKKATGTNTLYLACLQVSNQHRRTSFVSISFLHIIWNWNLKTNIIYNNIFHKCESLRYTSDKMWNSYNQNYMRENYTLLIKLRIQINGEINHVHCLEDSILLGCESSQNLSMFSI